MALLLSTLLLPALSGCVSRAEIKAEIWLQSGLPKDLCERYPDIAKSGLYRKLNSGKYEFLSYCKPQVKKYVSMHGDKFNEFLDETLPKKANQ